MTDETATQNAQTEAAEAQTTATAAGSTSGAAADTEARFTQADLDKMIGDRLAREREKAAKEAQKAQAEAERKALAENQEWKTLAERTAAELETARVAAARVERADELVKSMYENRLKTLPAPLRKAVESLPAQDPLDRLAWLDANEGLFKQTAGVPDINAGQGGPQKPPTVSLGGLTPEEFEARYGVRPKLS